ncbi:MAG: hypothetical protein ACRD68_06190, partial [Pyrinomonadaceae bacterium]
MAAGLPVTHSLAHWSHRPSVSRRSKGKHFRHRHSRAWWRRRRAYLRRKRARALVRAAYRARISGSKSPSSASAKLLPLPGGARTAAPVRAPFDLTLPASWSGTRVNALGEMKFAVRALDGRAAGTAVLAPVVVPQVESAVTARTKKLGGVPVSALRRTVIDRMLAEGGWVVNDWESNLQGRRVFVVLAKTGAAGAPQQTWTFYFTEVDGRIYSLATSSSVEFAEPVAADAVHVI